MRLVRSLTRTLCGWLLLFSLPVPALHPPLQVNYTYGGGDLMTEANNWLPAAAASNAMTHRTILAKELTLYDTLVALLTERKIYELLRRHGSEQPDVVRLPPRGGEPLQPGSLDLALARSAGPKQPGRLLAANDVCQSARGRPHRRRARRGRIGRAHG